MTSRAAVVLIGSLLAVPGCTRTVYIPVTSTPQPASASVPESRPAPRPEPPRERPAPAPAAAATLGIPAGHLPDPGACRIWIPGTPPGRQRYERSAPCNGISQAAPAGSWIVYRPSRDHKLVHVRVTDRNRAGSILVVHVFEIASGKFLRDEWYNEPPDDRVGPTTTTQTTPQRPTPDDPRRTPEQRPAPTYDPGTDRPIPVVPPPTNPQPAPELGPGGERRKPTPTTTTTAPTTPGPNTPAPNAPRPNTPAPNTPGPNTPAPNAPAPNTAPLHIPAGHLPAAGQCRIWIPDAPPGRQPHRASDECDRITREAPAGSWVVYRPTADKKAIHVRVINALRAGVVVSIRVYDESGNFVREDRP